MRFKIHTSLAVAVVTLGLSSCQKDFDPASYAPPLNIGGYSSSKEIASANLVGYWSFDGNLVDSVSTTPGVNTGTGFSPGNKGQALQGALNSYVVTTPSAGVTALKSFTITTWFNTPPPTTGVIGLFALANKNEFWGNLEIFIENGSTNENGKLRIHINNGSGDKTYSADNVLNLFDKWVGLAVSYDETTGTVTVYVNGSRASSGTVAGLTGPLNFVNTGQIVFGTTQFQTTPSLTTTHGSEPWASYLTGQLDEFRIYNKALSDAEIGALAKLEGRGK